MHEQVMSLDRLAPAVLHCRVDLKYYPVSNTLGVEHYENTGRVCTMY